MNKPVMWSWSRNFGPLKRLSADVAFGRVLILLPLLSTHPLHLPICLDLHHDRRLPLDENVQELGELILSDLHHRQLIVIAESRAEDGRCGAHFVLLGTGCLLHLTTERLENGLKVRIDHERRHGTELVIVELQLRLFGVGRREHVKHRHEVVAGAQLFVALLAFFCVTMSEAANADLMLVAMFCNV